MTIKVNEPNIRMALFMHGLSIRRLSKIIGLNESYISMIINGKRNPSAKTAHAISEVLGCPVTELFTIIKKEEVK